MSNPDEKAPGRMGNGPEAITGTNCSNPTAAPAEAQAPILNFNIDVHGFLLMAAELKELEKRNEEDRRALMERRWQTVRDGVAEITAELESCRMKHLSEVAKMKRRQQVADMLADAQLELAKIEIQIAKARLAMLRKGGRHE